MYSDNSWSSNLSSSKKKKKWNIGKSRDDVFLILLKIQEKHHTAHERCPKLSNSFAAHTHSSKINASVLLVENPFAATEKAEHGILALLQDHW